MNRLKPYLVATFMLVAALQCSGCNASPPKGEAGPPHDPQAISTAARKLSAISYANVSTSGPGAAPRDMPLSIEFSRGGYGTAYVAPVGKQYRVVHNGRPEKPYPSIGYLSISRDGKRVAYVAIQSEQFSRVVADGWEGPFYEDIGKPEFSPDGRHLAYTAKQGATTRIVVDNKLRYDFQLNQGAPIFSADSRYIAFAVKSPDGQKNMLVLSDLAFQDQKVIDSCGEKLVGNEDGTRLAVVCTEGNKQLVKEINFLQRQVVKVGAPQEPIVRLRFAADGQSVAYSTMKDGQRYLVADGKAEPVPFGNEVFSDPLVLAGPDGVAAIIGTAYKARLYGVTGRSTLQEREYGYIDEFVTSRDGRHHAYVVFNDTQSRIVVDGKEGPWFDRVTGPLFSPDGKILAYRARQNGKRFLVLADLAGNTIRQDRTYDMVFAPVFTRDGMSIAYGVKDGNELWWKVEKL